MAKKIERRTMPFRARLRLMLPTALVAVGALTISLGAALIYVPAGVILLGVFGVASGVLMIVGGVDE